MTTNAAKATITLNVLTADLPQILEHIDPAAVPTYAEPHGDTMQALAVEALRAWYYPSGEWNTDDDAIPTDVIDATAKALVACYES
jgi:hypothetical protein